MKLSVVIITFNEEKNLERCLKSLPSNVEIIVVDSGSTDKTMEIAKHFGATVFENEFKDYASQKNFACQQARHDWILSLDADERLNTNDFSQLEKAIDGHESASAYRIKRQLHFMGKDLRFGKAIDYPIRLFQKSKCQFEGEIHEQLKVDGITKSFTHFSMTHFSYESFTDYFNRFNRYTSLVAERHAAKGKEAGTLNLYFRFWFEFVSRYFIRLGFADGYPGYCYAIVSSFYAFIKYAKLDEIGARRHESS